MKSQPLPNAARTVVLFTVIFDAALCAALFTVWSQILGFASWIFWPSSWFLQRIVVLVTRPATTLVLLLLIAAFAWYRSSMRAAIGFVVASVALLMAPFVLLFIAALARQVFA